MGRVAGVGVGNTEPLDPSVVARHEGIKICSIEFRLINDKSIQEVCNEISGDKFKGVQISEWDKFDGADVHMVFEVVVGKIVKVISICNFDKTEIINQSCIKEFTDNKAGGSRKVFIKRADEKE